MKLEGVERTQREGMTDENSDTGEKERKEKGKWKGRSEEEVEGELGSSETVLDDIVLVLALDGPLVHGPFLTERSSSLAEDSMGSAVKVKKRGVEVEESTKELTAVGVAIVVLDHEHSELVHTLQLDVHLGHDVVVACLIIPIQKPLGSVSSKKKKKK